MHVSMSGVKYYFVEFFIIERKIPIGSCDSCKFFKGVFPFFARLETVGLARFLLWHQYLNDFFLAFKMRIRTASLQSNFSAIFRIESPSIPFSCRISIATWTMFSRFRLFRDLLLCRTK